MFTKDAYRLGEGLELSVWCGLGKRPIGGKREGLPPRWAFGQGQSLGNDFAIYLGEVAVPPVTTKSSKEAVEAPEPPLRPANPPASGMSWRRHRASSEPIPDFVRAPIRAFAAASECFRRRSPTAPGAGRPVGPSGHDPARTGGAPRRRLKRCRGAPHAILTT